MSLNKKLVLTDRHTHKVHTQELETESVLLSDLISDMSHTFWAAIIACQIWHQTRYSSQSVSYHDEQICIKMLPKICDTIWPSYLYQIDLAVRHDTDLITPGCVLYPLPTRARVIMSQDIWGYHGMSQDRDHRIGCQGDVSGYLGMTWDVIG